MRLACWPKGKTLSQILECIREEAKLASQFDVYQVTVFGEIDSAVGRGNMEKYGKEILKEIKKYYQGKVGIGFCCFNENYPAYDFSGFDFLLADEPGQSVVGEWYGKISR